MSKWKTTMKKSTLNPVYNELCEIDVSTMSIEDVQVDVVVMKYDRFGHNDEVGSVSFGDDVSHKSGQEHWKKIMVTTNAPISKWHVLSPPTITAGSGASVSSRSPRRSPMHITSCMSMTPSGMQL